MTLESLLVSRDTELIRTLQPAFERFSVAVEICVGPNAGTEIMATEHFDAVIVDCDDLRNAVDVLKSVRRSSANKTSVALAVVNGKTSTTDAFAMGANVVLQKPVSSVNAVRGAHAAVGMMASERRRYYRHAVEFAVKAEFSQGGPCELKATDISGGGLALHFDGEFPGHPITAVKFSLPGLDKTFEFQATAAWVDERGRAGIRFVKGAAETKRTLEGWLVEQFTQTCPELAYLAEKHAGVPPSSTSKHP